MQLEAEKIGEKREKKGEKKGKFLVASQMKLEGFPPEMIAKCTGLTLKEIESLE